MATDLCKYFEVLAERMWKENDLSDMTYALCQSDNSFKQFFLDFFFGSGAIDAKKAKIERETCFAEGRPDFTIRTPQMPDFLYLVEVKIWNGSQHFAQYGEILKGKGKLGYIANYAIVKGNLSEVDQEVYEYCDNDKTVKTWKQFVTQLEAYCCLNNDLIQAYVAYVKKVCPFDAYTLKLVDAFHINDFATANTLYQNIRNVKVNKCEIYTCNKNFESKLFWGEYFEWDFNGQSVWGWYGVIYVGEKTVLCIDFEDVDDWGKPVCDKCRDILPFENGSLRFCYDSTSTSPNPPSEGEINGFLTDVLDAVSNMNFDKSKFKFSAKDVGYSGLQPVFILKSLPCFLEEYFYGLKLDNGLVIEADYYNDQEILGKHCGRYFKILNAKDEELNGWIGVAFYEKNKPVFMIELNKDKFLTKFGEKDGWNEDSLYKELWMAHDFKCNYGNYSGLLEEIKNVLNAVFKKI